MKTFTPTDEACQLLLEGTLALSEIEGHGIRIDRDYLEKALTDTAEQIKSLEQKMRQDDDYRLWSRQFGDRTNLASAEQLATIVFTEKGHKSKVKTKSGKRASASEKALEGINLPIVKMYLEMQHLRKGRDTFLVGIHREIVQHQDGDWYSHPVYHHNVVSSFRSSCSDFNVQNQPNRMPMLAEMIRKSMLPRRGNQILEFDYAQQEVRISECYHLDPTMKEYIESGKDMHMDVAKQVFLLEENQVTKAIRHLAKNQVTFPFFYGSFYAKIAPNVWDMMSDLKLKDSTVLLRDHLRDKGIEELGNCDPQLSPIKNTFEDHLKEMEADFWGERFPVYGQWRKDWVSAYQRDGGCQFKTGFIMTGPHARNDITNYAIQGSAYHCLLKAIITINRTLKKYKMGSRIIAQIHDCVVMDVVPSEREDVIFIVRDAMVRCVMRDWKWINVPLECEVESCPVDRSWFDKMSLVERGGKWVPADEAKWQKLYGSWA